MASSEDREKHSKRRKRNFVAKALREHYKPKVLDPRKSEYKRIKINPNNIEEIIDDDQD